MADATDAESDRFHDRLLAAFVNLSEGRKAAIRDRMEREGITGGLKAGIARLVGIKTPSLLSDMLSGRTKGQRYQEALAAILGVSQAWLHGDDSAAPDWARPPIEAYERWLLALRRAWKEWFGEPAGDAGSVSPAVDGPLLGDETRWSALTLSAADRRSIGQRLLLAAHDPVLDDLIRGDWERVPLATLLTIGKVMGVPEPDHLEIVRQGHGQAAEARRQQDWIVRRLTRRMQRYWLPARLFQATRLALVALRQQRRYQGKDTVEVEDSLELLWRQQYQQQGETPAVPPPAFTEETGRTAWSSLTAIGARYGEMAPEDPADRYRSSGPWQAGGPDGGDGAGRGG